MNKEPTNDLIIKEKDDEYLDILDKALPAEGFNKNLFVKEVKLAAQDVRKLELNQDAKDPTKKIIQPGRQKSYVNGKLRGKAYDLYKLLRTLPDDCEMRINNQHELSRHTNDGYEITPGTAFTNVTKDILRQFIDYCENSYQHNNQGWRNLYKTQESRIALAWTMSGAEITTTGGGPFFNTLCNFRNYCQVDGYSQDQVSSTEIHRIQKQLS